MKLHIIAGIEYEEEQHRFLTLPVEQKASCGCLE